MLGVPNAQIRELCGMIKAVDERFDEVVLWWFGHDRNAMKECVLVVIQWVALGRNGLILCRNV